MKTMVTVDEAARQIADNKPLLIAGDETLLAKIPRGNWIGGSIPYFMSEDGGVIARDRLQITRFPNTVSLDRIKVYAESELPSIPRDYPTNGFSIILIPAFSAVHQAFAKNSFSYEHIFDAPLVGWITGFHLSDLGKTSAKVVEGPTGRVLDNAAMVMHLTLPDNLFARSNIINLFTQSTGDRITFESVGFSAREALVNGDRVNLARYLKDRNVDTRLPLVASYEGAMINVSFQQVNEQAGEVSFYAPVFPDIEYRLAKAMPSYEVEFEQELKKRAVSPAWSCNCILNFLYANLEGKKTGDVVGPITFGEIAYILLNQTMVYLTIEQR
jgi:hypothetical protein